MSKVHSTDNADITIGHLKQLSITDPSCSRSPSPGRRTGINLGISVIKEQQQQQEHDYISDNSSETRNSNDSERSNQESLKDKIDMAESQSQELSTRFQLLASKEMEILEVTNAIKELTNKRRALQREIVEIKSKLQGDIVKKVINNNRVSPARNRSKLGGQVPKSMVNSNEGIRSNSTSQSEAQADSSWLSKPINFLQKFDSVITHELTNLDMPQQPRRNEKYILRKEQRKLTPILDSKGREISSPLRSLADKPAAPEIVQSVSDHIWSFVSEVKSNMMSDQEIKNGSIPPKQTKSTTKVLDKTSSQLEKPISEDDLWDEDDLIDI